MVAIRHLFNLSSCGIWLRGRWAVESESSEQHECQRSPLEISAVFFQGADPSAEIFYVVLECLELRPANLDA